MIDLNTVENPKNYIEKLCSELNEASDLYYNEGRSTMTDKEFDDKMSLLEALQDKTGYCPENSPIHKVGAPVRPEKGRREVIHEIRARSLDKTKDVNEIVTKLGGHSDELVVGMWKLDGCTVVLTYVDGDLVLAATRGNGEIGTDITSNTKYIEGIPQHISVKKGKLIVRGECIMSYADFEAINASLPEGVEPYANPRNLASASATMLNPEDMKDRHLAFQAFDFVSVDAEFTSDAFFRNEDSLTDQFVYLHQNGFGVVRHDLFRLSDIDKIVDTFTEDAETFEYPVDGLVFALDNRAVTKNLPGTEHHPDHKYGYAFKWADETKETVLRDIEWSPSRTGLFNPVAIFDPVELNGTTVTRASLYDLSYITDKMLIKGDRITVYKANMIIPKLDKNLTWEEECDPLTDTVSRLAAINLQVPEKCPLCNHTLNKVWTDQGRVGVVRCYNRECPAKFIGNLTHFCSREGMDIDGWSEQTLKKLIELHYVKEFKDIFLLKNHAGLAFVPGFGKRSWEKLCHSAEDASHTTFVKFVSALSIPNVGKGQAKTLKRYLDESYKILNQRYRIDGYHPFILLVEMACHDFDFTVIDGIGPVMAYGISKWFKENYGEGQGDTPYKRLMTYVDFTDKEPISSDFMNPPTISQISGKSFCITGKLIHHSNRQELVDKIEANGGKWVDSVSSKTDYLINNDVASTSGKNKKAHELNIPIISEEDFLKMLS